MVSQLRHTLDEYKRGGGAYTEIVLEECGHSPHIEKPEAFLGALLEHLA
jgi:pimeloyl-ACP methyl ester carboxylesterase